MCQVVSKVSLFHLLGDTPASILRRSTQGSQLHALRFNLFNLKEYAMVSKGRRHQTKPSQGCDGVEQGRQSEALGQAERKGECEPAGRASAGLKRILIEIPFLNSRKSCSKLFLTNVFFNLISRATLGGLLSIPMYYINISHCLLGVKLCTDGEASEN